MTVCNDCLHEEIVHNSRECPLCELSKEIIRLQERIEDMEKEEKC